MTKFKTPVQYKVASEQQADNLILKLKELGYTIKDKNYQCGKYPYITNYFLFDSGNVGLWERPKNKPTVIMATSEEMFLALAAMRDDDYNFHVGEYLKIVYKGDSDWNVGYIGKVVSVESRGIAKLDTTDKPHIKKPNTSSMYAVKATAEEIIAHFSGLGEMQHNLQNKSTQTNNMEKKIIGYKLKPKFQSMQEACESITRFDTFDFITGKSKGAPNSSDEYIVRHTIAGATACHKKLVAAGVLDLWFDPIYEDDSEKVVSMVSFNVHVRNKKVFHDNSDITQFVKELVEFYGHQRSFGGFSSISSEVIFSKTGCQNSSTTLTQWKAVYDMIK